MGEAAARVAALARSPEYTTLLLSRHQAGAWHRKVTWQRAARHTDAPNRFDEGDDSVDTTIQREKLDQATGILGELDLDCWLTFVRETSVVPDPALMLINSQDVTWPS